MTGRHRDVGAAGERFAAWWLGQRGLTVVGHNIEVESGELDLVMIDGGVEVAVEVRSITGPGDPIDAVSEQKRRHVRRLAGGLGIARVDHIGIGFRSWGVEVHWVPG